MSGLPNREEKRSSASVSGRDHYERLVRFLSARLANKQDAEDLTQEAYLRLLRASRTRFVEDPAAYLFRIARNLLHEWYASSKLPTRMLTEEVLVSEDLSVEDSVAVAQHMERLEDVLGGLSPKCRAVILMHRRDGMTYKEIGCALEISAAMVKKYLSQGLARCRTDMGRYYEARK